VLSLSAESSHPTDCTVVRSSTEYGVSEYCSRLFQSESRIVAVDYLQLAGVHLYWTSCRIHGIRERPDARHMDGLVKDIPLSGCATGP
jgi:hypothetical protein